MVFIAHKLRLKLKGVQCWCEGVCMVCFILVRLFESLWRSLRCSNTESLILMASF